jgi:transcriptional regulator with XRE-family HTH domain
VNLKQKRDSLSTKNLLKTLPSSYDFSRFNQQLNEINNGSVDKNVSIFENGFIPGREQTMDKVKMGQFLSQLRTEKSLRQQDEAEIFEVSPQAISKWESGDSVPDIATLEKLSHFFDVGIDEIINGERKNPSAPATNTVVLARNPSLEERGIGKPYFGAFIYGMSALVLSFIFAAISYLGVKDETGAKIFFNFYQVLFKSDGIPVFVGWLGALSLFASALLTIGLWLDSKHRHTYWLASFWCNVAHLFFNAAFFVYLTVVSCQVPSELGPSVGSFLFMIFAILYFVLFLCLPITRKSTYCPKKAIQSDPKDNQ